MPPAGRITDPHTCPAHGGGPVLPPGVPLVLIGGLPAAHLADMAACAGPPDALAQGAAMVLVGGRPASRVGDLSVHLGTLTGGLANVLIGGAPAPATDSLLLALKLIDAKGTANAVDVALVAQQLAKYPPHMLQIMLDQHTRVIACRGSVTDYRSDLKGVRPRGWPPGSTWDTVPGAFMPDRNEVVICTRGHDTPEGPHVPGTGEGHGSSNLVLHESAHSIDLAAGSGRSSGADFNAARNKDVPGLPAYETQPGTAGQQESYAESAARYYGGDPGDAAAHPNLHKYWASQPLKPL